MRRDQRLIEQAFKAVVMSAGVFAVVTRPVPRRGRPVFDGRKISPLWRRGRKIVYRSAGAIAAAVAAIDIADPKWADPKCRRTLR